jgi:hypothetical protein
MVERGELEARCNYHMTDDYALDAANDFGKTGWIPVRIRHPKYEGNFVTDDDFVEGQINLTRWDFKTKTGTAYYNTDGTINLCVHGNLNYTLRKKTAKPRIKRYAVVVPV